MTFVCLVRKEILHCKCLPTNLGIDPIRRFSNRRVDGVMDSWIKQVVRLLSSVPLLKMSRWRTTTCTFDRMEYRVFLLQTHLVTAAVAAELDSHDHVSE